MSLEKVKALLEDYKKEQAENAEKILQAERNLEHLCVVRSQLVGAIFATENIVRMIVESEVPVVPAEPTTDTNA